MADYIEAMSLERAFDPSTAGPILAGAAAVILLAALGLQYLGGLPPCPLCVWQRYPYLAVIALGLLAWFWRPRLTLVLAALLLLGNAGLAGYHLGIEQGVWALPAGCVAGGQATSVEELRQMLATAGPTCDQVTFRLLGLSLAAWNGLIALALAACALSAASARRGRSASLS